MQVLGALLLILGILAMVYGGFWYDTTEKTKVDVGPVEVEGRVEKKERVNIPLWAGIATTVIGAVILATGAAGHHHHHHD
jgi:hypothetical protein